MTTTEHEMASSSASSSSSSSGSSAAEQIEEEIDTSSWVFTRPSADDEDTTPFNSPRIMANLSRKLARLLLMGAGVGGVAWELVESKRRDARERKNPQRDSSSPCSLLPLVSTVNGDDEVPDDLKLVTEEDVAEALRLKGDANKAFAGQFKSRQSSLPPFLLARGFVLTLAHFSIPSRCFSLLNHSQGLQGSHPLVLERDHFEP